jgi:hypothetical protein
MVNSDFVSLIEKLLDLQWCIPALASPNGCHPYVEVAVRTNISPWYRMQNVSIYFIRLITQIGADISVQLKFALNVKKTRQN